MGVCLHDRFLEKEWVPVPAVTIAAPHPPKEFHQHFSDVHQLCGKGSSAVSTRRSCSIRDKQLDVPYDKKHFEDKALRAPAPKDLGNHDNSAVRLWFPKNLIWAVGGVNKSFCDCCTGMAGIKLVNKNGTNLHHQRQDITTAKHQQSALRSV